MYDNVSNPSEQGINTTSPSGSEGFTSPNSNPPLFTYPINIIDFAIIMTLKAELISWLILPHHPLHRLQLQTCAANANEKGDKASLIPHSRWPALPSLQIPTWSLDAALSSFAKTDGPSTSTYFKDHLS
ncbi:hypothetical protein HN51_009197 [Arachis hypogaea]